MGKNSVSGHTYFSEESPAKKKKSLGLDINDVVGWRSR